MLFMALVSCASIAYADDESTPMIASGVNHTLALDRDGRIYGWGSDADGQLGQGRQLHFKLPTRLSRLPAISAVSVAGDEIAPQLAALDRNGNVWTWGLNGAWLGPRGDTAPATPARVIGIDRVAQVAAGRSAIAALKQDGTVWYWGVMDGLPFAGQPTVVAGLSDVTRIAAGDRNLFAQRRDGSLWAVGRNTCGELGDGTTVTRSAWVRISLPAAPSEFHSSNGQSVAVVNGQVHVWGQHLCTGPVLAPRAIPGLAAGSQVVVTYGLLRLRDTNGTIRQAVWQDGGTFALSTIALLQGAQSLAQSQTHIYGLANGIVRSYGSNSEGQLGNDSFTASDAVVTARVPASVQTIGAAGRFAIALTHTGEVYGWGGDGAGQLSGISPGGTTVPKPIPQTFGLVRSIHAGQRASFAVLQDGRLIAWGDNSTGGLGTGDQVARSSPTLSLVRDVASVAVDPAQAIALKTNGTVVAIGTARDASGQMVVETPVAGLTRIRAVAAAHFTRIYYAIDQDGALFVWGQNVHGGFANGQRSEVFAAPQRIPLPGPVAEVSSSGTHTLARLADGRVFAWGQNDQGQLCDNSRTERLTPVASGIAGAFGVSAGVATSLYIGTDRVALACGAGTFTGTGVSDPVLLPQPIRSATGATFRGVAQVSGGFLANTILASDGVLYAFGESRPGAREATLGDGTFGFRPFAVAVSQANGGGRTDTNDWYLDLNASVPNVGVALDRRVAPVATALGTRDSLTLSASLATRNSDTSQIQSMFVLGRVPATFFTAVGQAIPPSIDAAKRAKADTDLILVQLTPTGWQVVTGQLTALVTNVTAGNATASNILRNVNLTAIPGARFCIGYGTDPTALLQAGTLAEILNLPGVAATSGGMPCIISGAYLSGPTSGRDSVASRFQANIVGVQPSGTVQLRNGATALGSPTTLTGSDTQVARTVNFDSILPVGSNALTVSYSGDTTNAASTSAILTHVVSAAPTIPVVVTATASSRSVQGDAVRVAVTVTGDRPEGAVQIRRGSEAIGESAALVNGAAGLTLNGLAAGDYVFTASYAGDARNAASTSASFNHIVEPVAGGAPSANLPTLSLALASPDALIRVGAPFGVLARHSQASASGPVSLIAANGATLATGMWTNGSTSLTVALGEAGSQALSATWVAGDGSTLRSPALTVTVFPAFASTADTDGDGVNDMLEASLGLNLWVRDNDIFADTSRGRELFVMQQYRDFLGREADAAGIAFWAGEIAATRQTRTSMADAFFNSPEFQAALAPIARLYFATYDRIPDYEGMQFWVGELGRGRALASIGDVFATAPEFVSRYGNLSNRDYVDRLYRNVLGRAADMAGIDFWTAQLAGGTTRGAMLTNFSESNEYKARVANAVFVNAMYVAFLRRGPDSSGFDFWRRELDGGRRGSDLVNVFLAAPEYRLRFLP
jgi:alpha-tubulin suppressor-like RCC1 family protein